MLLLGLQAPPICLLPMSSDDALCKYTYKPCTNQRVMKRNGALHLLCAFHRDRANAIQKIHAANKKLRQALATMEPSDFTGHDDGFDLASVVDNDELQYLCELLLSGESDDE
ncbi:hypothetical protein SDRG_02905 [Saprolegnia diclina VS20]|uniref:Uncharacterized protein n=1 Tax=Saprolegnia diclina (strain VS20) TaxID=1156394 RepID=T0QQ45_SAPDV|nr:hypothetical protein SDRG_02905 [Saprolegnia diclina VS20]EQC40259.1 hypothetical protein SDRG_02905 [Saprolegnia diclina VS20]|eukprot:XP_008606733.1 hypothetical protein SDRG_02905 [Saprolegnia diclina VS20]